VILIAGDSFSDANSSLTCARASVGNASWVRMLAREYSVQCVALLGSSNYDIARQIWKQPGLKIVNLSHPHRLTRHHAPPDFDGYELNMLIAQKISQMSDTICWTPFVGYEHLNIASPDLDNYNEYYSDEAKSRCTCHHLTQEGNERLYSWIKEKIDDFTSL